MSKETLTDAVYIFECVIVEETEDYIVAHSKSFCGEVFHLRYWSVPSRYGVGDEVTVHAREARGGYGPNDTRTVYVDAYVPWPAEDLTEAEALDAYGEDA